MQTIEEVFSKETLDRNDLANLRYLATQGDPAQACDRVMMIEATVWRIVTDPGYAGDITLADLED